MILTNFEQPNTNRSWKKEKSTSGLDWDCFWDILSLPFSKVTAPNALYCLFITELSIEEEETAGGATKQRSNKFTEEEEESPSTTANDEEEEEEYLGML